MKQPGHPSRRALAAAICFCSSLAIGGARADVVMDWNATAAGLPIAAPPAMARVLAAMHGAMHDAVNSIEPRYELYRFKVESAPGSSIEAAAASAAHAVLAALVPAQRATFDAALGASLARIPEGRPKADGISVGRSAAEQMLAWRAKDGFDAKVADRPGTAAGDWQRTPPQMASGVMAQVGDVTPFVLQVADQFPAKARFALTSREFERDVDEVRRLGGRRGSARTAEQTAVAIFWSGNEIPQLNAAARAAAIARKLTLHENARLFALMHMAGADAAIATFKLKYARNEWRPVTAIRAGAAGIPPDPAWDSLLVTPPHPEFPSGHCLVTGAFAQAYRELLGSDEVRLDYVYPPGGGVMRSYTSFTQIEKEMEDARVWGGIHFRTTDEQSTELGRAIGRYVATSALRPLPVKPDAQRQGALR